MEASIQSSSHDTCCIPKPNHHMVNLQRKCPQPGSRCLELLTSFQIIKRVERQEDRECVREFILLLEKNRSIVNLQCCVSFRRIFLSEDGCHDVNLHALGGPVGAGDFQRTIQRA